MSLKRYVQHVSPSSLNLWIANPRQWAWRYLLKQREPTGPAMARGSAVEVGLKAWLHFEDIELAIKYAYTNFDANVQGEISDAIDAEHKLIEPMVRQLAGLDWPGLNATQIKIEHWLDEIDVPCIGYVDFAFEDGDLDLKTTKACPSAPKGPHVRQVALYRAARKKPGGLLYVTGKKSAPFEVTDDMMNSALADMTQAAKSLSRFLSKIDNPDDAMACLPNNPDDFRTSPFVPRGTSSGFEATEIQ